MGNMVLNRRINAPREWVFAVFTDLRNAPGRIEAIKSLEVLTDGPVGKGTRFRETRIMFGKEATETMEITDFQPSRTYTVSATSCGSYFETTFTFTAEGQATQVEMRIQTKALTLFAKLMTPLCIFFAGAMKKMMMKDIEDLAIVAEAGEGAAAQPVTE